jgi:hypothetical protein
MLVIKGTYMNILERIKQASIPVNQPVVFPHLYLIPETVTVQASWQSANDPHYWQPAPIQNINRQKHESFIQRFVRRRREAISRRLDAAWQEVKAFGRAVVRWLVWRVFLPLSIIASLWIPVVNPAELPL